MGHSPTYIDSAVRNTEEENGDGQLDLRRASIVYFRGFGVILPKWIHELPGLNCQERRWLDRWQTALPQGKPLPSHALKPVPFGKPYKLKASQNPFLFILSLSCTLCIFFCPWKGRMGVMLLLLRRSHFIPRFCFSKHFGESNG